MKTKTLEELIEFLNLKKINVLKTEKIECMEVLNIKVFCNLLEVKRCFQEVFEFTCLIEDVKHITFPSDVELGYFILHFEK